MGSIEASAIDIVEARVGTTLRDKWRVDSLIGIGGMAAVYAATHRNGNRVALKVLHQQLSVDSNIRSRFRREGYVANLIVHPGIVRVLDDDVTHEGSVFLVMDLLEGETAEARARRLGGRLPLEDVFLVADGLLDVIAAAHAAGVVHRDIKPENVFVTLDREVKVLDFGIAGLRDGFAGASGMKTATMMGTPAFMPPEQALGRMAEVDALSDVWAVGASMFNLISGVLVHEAETANELLILAATERPRSLAAAAPDAPAQLVEIVDRALAVEKTKRWSSARAMQHALRQAAAEILREPLPQPMSARMRVHTPQTLQSAFRPKAFSPGGLDDTIIGQEADWNVQSGISIAHSGDMRALLSPTPARIDTSTLHPTNAAVVTRASSSKRVLLLAGGASLMLAIVGSIGLGMAMRAEVSVPTTIIPPAAAQPVSAPQASTPTTPATPATPTVDSAPNDVQTSAAVVPETTSIELDTPTKPGRSPSPKPAGTPA